MFFILYLRMRIYHFNLQQALHLRILFLFIQYNSPIISFDSELIVIMGNKNEKSSFDQELLDKLMEETGLEREVIIAWRFVNIFFGQKYFSFCL